MPETERRKAASWEDEAKRFIRESYNPKIAKKLLGDFDTIVAMAFFAEKMCDEREDSALLEAAGLVCPFCADTEIWRKTIHDDVIGAWLHRRLTDAPDDVQADDRMCAAYKIHERRALKGNG